MEFKNNKKQKTKTKPLILCPRREVREIKRISIYNIGFFSTYPYFISKDYVFKKKKKAQLGTYLKARYGVENY